MMNKKDMGSRIAQKGAIFALDIGAGSYKKNGGYCKFECKPGNYYVVGVYLGASSWGGMPHQTWKGQSATATKNKGTVVEINLSTFRTGCQN